VQAKEGHFAARLNNQLAMATDTNTANNTAPALTNISSRRMNMLAVSEPSVAEIPYFIYSITGGGNGGSTIQPG
jgi:hypothetical protein